MEDGPPDRPARGPERRAIAGMRFACREILGACVTMLIVLTPLSPRLRWPLQCLLIFELLGVLFLTMVNALVSSIQSDLFQDPLLGPVETVGLGAAVALALGASVQVVSHGRVRGPQPWRGLRYAALGTAIVVQPVVAWVALASAVSLASLVPLAAAVLAFGGLLWTLVGTSATPSSLA